MARNSKKQNENLIIDFESQPFEGGEDLLAAKNKRILSSFGDNAGSASPAISQGKTVRETRRMSPLESLKSRMIASTGANPVTAAPASQPKKVKPIAEPKKTEPEIKPQKTEPAAEQLPIIPTNEKPEAPVVKTPEISETEERLKSVIGVADKAPESPKNEQSLLEKLKRYTTDETGHDVSENELPLYKLESVAEIIKSDSNKLLNKLSEKYDVTIDTLGKPTNDDYLLKGFEDEKKEDEKPQPANEDNVAKEATPAFKDLSARSKKHFEKTIFDELFPVEEKETEKAPEKTPDISDIDNSHITDEPKEEKLPEADAATVRFTPVVDKTGNTGRINISSTTRSIDIRQELTNANPAEDKDADTPPELSAFDLYAQKGEITDMATARNTIKKLAYKQRRNFLSTALSALCLAIMLLFVLPFLSDKLISDTKTSMIVCSALLFISILANIDMFADIPNLFKRRAGHDSMVALCATLSIPFCLLSAIGGKNSYYLVLLSAVIMFTRAAVNLMQTSTMLSNLKQIAGRGEKHAVAFIKDNATARAMAKDAIEGDVLIAAPRKAEFISDFMKFSLFKRKLSGKMLIVFAVTFGLAALGYVVAYLYYKNVFDALAASTITSMVAAMPCVCLIDTLPLYCAAKKLNRKGAMLAGTFGADSIELSNAVVVNTADLFPSGSILLKSLKVLSDNDIDKTLVHAAALTEEAGSPLAPLLNQIAGTNTSYKKPDSDTIKYEERLGLSGWVDNELLFIGNRTLMQAHGIEVPNIEFDHKILHSGYFPVYIATGGNACALLVIEYRAKPEIQRIVRKISKLGITMLIENSDPNVNEKMICDYLGIYEDSVKVMTNVGVHMYKNAVSDTSVISAPASFKGSKISLLRIMCCASSIRSSNLILSVCYILSAIFGIWFFIANSFTSSGGLLAGGSILAFEILATLLSLIAFLFKKP